MIFCHILQNNFTLISLINAINPHRINVIAIIRDNLHSHVVAIIDKSSGRRNNTAVSGVGGNFISVNVENCRKRVIFSHISKRITISAADGIIINNETINEITVFGSNIEGQIVAAQNKNIPIWSNVSVGSIGNRNRVFVFCKCRRHNVIFGHILQNNFTVISMINTINPDRINEIAIIRDNLHSHVVAIINQGSGRRNEPTVSVVGRNLVRINVENCRKRVIFSHISKRITISTADGIAINNETINEITVFWSNIEGQIVAAQNKNIPIWSNIAIGGIGNRNRVFVFCKRRRHNIIFGHILQNNFIVISLINPINPDRINEIAIIRNNLQSHVVAIINQGSGRRNDTAVSVVGRNLVRINVENCRKRVIFSHISKRITISTADGIAINNQIINEITVFGSNIEGQIVAAQNKNIPIWRNIAIGGIGNRNRVFVLCKCRRHDMIFGHILQNNFIVISMINVINPYRINEIAIIRDNLQSHIVAIIEKCSGRRNDTAVSGKSVYLVRINVENCRKRVIFSHISKRITISTADGIAINNETINEITVFWSNIEGQIVAAQNKNIPIWSNIAIGGIGNRNRVFVFCKRRRHNIIFGHILQNNFIVISLINPINPDRINEITIIRDNLQSHVVAIIEK